MPANNNPIFTLSPDIQWASQALANANTAKDGTGAVATVFTADATNGGFISRLTARSAGTNVNTVLRLFINNGGANSVAANNVLIGEMTLPATTLSEVASQPDYALPLNFALPAGYKLNCTLGTAVAAGYFLSVIGGKY
jgi:alkaline phosphatase